MGARTVRWSSSQRAWASAASPHRRPRPRRRRSGRRAPAAGRWRARPPSAATRASRLVGGRARLVEAGLGGEVAARELGLAVEIALGVGQRRLGLGEIGLELRDLLRPLAELQIGQLGSALGQLRLGLAHRRALPAVLEREQEVARPRPDRRAAPARLRSQPAAGRRRAGHTRPRHSPAASRLAAVAAASRQAAASDRQ